MSSMQKMPNFAEYSTKSFNRKNELENNRAYLRHDPLLLLSDSQFVASTFDVPLDINKTNGLKILTRQYFECAFTRFTYVTREGRN